MSMPGEFLRRLQMLLHRGRFQADLEEEMRLHLDLRAAAADRCRICHRMRPASPRSENSAMPPVSRRKAT